MKEDYSSAAPTTAPNTSLGIKAGPAIIGKKQKGGKQGSQRAPAETQIIMAGDNNKNQKVVETLSPSASTGAWIHDFVHSKNPEFDGKSKKERIKMALGAYYGHHKEQVSEAQEHGQEDIRPKDFIHAGFGAKGGAGFHGHVDKVAKGMVHFTGTETHIGMNGKPFKKTYKAPIGHVTVLHREDVTVSMDDVYDIIQESMSYADWHDHMEGKGAGTEKGTEFKIKNAGGRTEAHLNGKKIGHYDHTKKTAHISEATVGMPLKGHPYHHKTDAELHYIMKDAGEASRLHDQMHKDPKIHPNKYADQVNDAATVLHYRRKGGKQLKEDIIFEDGAKASMKRKYLGKTRGTTATGKPAHQVVIDPVLKIDDKMNNGRPRLPAPDRGM